MRKHTKTKRKPAHSSNQHLTKLFLGIAAGGLVGVGTALLLAPKHEDSLQDSLTDAYKNIRSKANGYAKKGANALNSASDYAENLRGKASEFLDYASDNTSSRTTILLGAIGGGILGIASVLLLSPTTGKEIRDELVEAYEKTTDLASHLGKTGKHTANYFNSIDWGDLATDVVQTVTSKLKSTAEDVRHSLEDTDEDSEEGHSNLQEAIKWAALGLRLWQNVKSGR